MPKSPTVLGRLLEEISWEGNARIYHHGGRGRENVLTAEMCQALDFLPRRAFFGSILATAVGAVDTVKALAEEVENATFSLLPGDIHLAKRPGAELWLQPDGIIESPSVYCILEAKRIKCGSFQPQQLAREYLAALQEAQAKRPLLLLVLPASPPVPVSRHGRLDLTEAIGKARSHRGASSNSHPRTSCSTASAGWLRIPLGPTSRSPSRPEGTASRAATIRPKLP